MIVDCYTHTWTSTDQLGKDAAATCRFPHLPDRVLERDHASSARHLAAADPVDMTVVVGFKSAYLGAEISNARVAEYVADHPGKLVGFAGIDPSDPKQALEELNEARDELNMPGIAVAPAAQDFHPSNSSAMLVYAEAAERRMPVLFHTGVSITAATKLEYAQPILLDEVARELPDLTIIIAHMGYPWMHETVALLAKHPNVYTEISWLLHQPWQAYQALLGAHRCGVIDKLLFGSGFPYGSASQGIEDLFSINHLVHGTNLPTIPREQLRGIVERDTLGILGLAATDGATSSTAGHRPEVARTDAG